MWLLWIIFGFVLIYICIKLQDFNDDDLG